MTSGGWLGPGLSGHRKGGGGAWGWGARAGTPGSTCFSAQAEAGGRGRCRLPAPPSAPAPVLSTPSLDHWTPTPRLLGSQPPLAQTCSVGHHTSPTLVFIFTDGGIGGSGCWDESLSLRGNAGQGQWAAVLPPQRAALKPWTKPLPCLFTPHPQLSLAVCLGTAPWAFQGSPFLLILALSRSCARV